MIKSLRVSICNKKETEINRWNMRKANFRDVRIVVKTLKFTLQILQRLNRKLCVLTLILFKVFEVQRSNFKRSPTNLFVKEQETT